MTGGGKGLGTGMGISTEIRHPHVEFRVEGFWRLTLGIYNRGKRDVEKKNMKNMKKRRRKGARELARKESDFLLRFGMTYLDTVVQGDALVERHFSTERLKVRALS